jgi:membrane protease YdiL (CAAX protease family)
MNYLFSSFKMVLKEKNTIPNNISFFSILDFLFSSLFIKISIIVLLASMEEYIFRAYIFSFTNSHFSLVISTLINALVFYIVHTNSKIFELMFMDVVFVIITLYTNNMLTAIVAHTTNNIIVYFVRRILVIRKLKMANKNIQEQ